MVIYAFIPMSRVHASYYYRMIVPLQTMEDMGLPVTVLIDDMDRNTPTEYRRDGLIWSDIVWMYQATDPLLRHNVNIISDMKAMKGQDDKLWYPASFVVDTDDNLFNVSPWNWAFRTLGVKHSDGTFLNPGSKIEFETPEGELKILWEDGKDGFNVADNIAKLENYRMLCQSAGIMTCSTPETERYVKKEIGKNTRTFVNPNCVRFDHYQDVALAPHKEIRIMWQGSNTHYEDIYNIHKALGRVMKKYPEAKLVFWGEQFVNLIKAVPREQVESIPWMDYDKYHLRLVTVGPDINICPLMPTTFNQSRSAIKWYEASLLHDPAATIAQRSGAYKDEMEHGKTGLLYDTEEEFEQHLCTLIEDAKLRRELAANAKDWVHENRDAFKVVPKLYEFFQDVRARKRETCEIDEDVPTEQPDVRASEDKDSESS